MNIKVLGTQAPYVRYGHNGPGYLVTTVQGDNILLDCGSGSTHMMKLPDDLEFAAQAPCFSYGVSGAVAGFH